MDVPWVVGVPDVACHALPKEGPEGVTYWECAAIDGVWLGTFCGVHRVGRPQSWVHSHLWARHMHNDQIQYTLKQVQKTSSFWGIHRPPCSAVATSSTAATAAAVAVALLPGGGMVTQARMTPPHR